MKFYRKKVRMFGIFDDDIWSECGKAIAYAIPTSFLLTIFYYKFPSVLIALSGTIDAATLMDVFVHSFASAGICGLTVGMIRKNCGRKCPLNRDPTLVAVSLALLIMVPVWEGFEQAAGKSIFLVNEDWMKDVISDLVGAFSYVGIESLRKKISSAL